VVNTLLAAAARAADDVILPKGWRTAIQFTSRGGGIDGRLTRILNQFATCVRPLALERS